MEEGVLEVIRQRVHAAEGVQVDGQSVRRGARQAPERLGNVAEDPAHPDRRVEEAEQLD